MPELKDEKLFESLVFEQKLAIKSQIKWFDAISDYLKDLSELISFVNSKEELGNQISEIIGMFKIECKYGIKERLSEIERK